MLGPSPSGQAVEDVIYVPLLKENNLRCSSRIWDNFDWLSDTTHGKCALLLWSLHLRKQILEHLRYHWKSLLMQMNTLVWALRSNCHPSYWGCTNILICIILDVLRYLGDLLRLADIAACLWHHCRNAIKEPTASQKVLDICVWAAASLWRWLC